MKSQEEKCFSIFLSDAPLLRNQWITVVANLARREKMRVVGGGGISRPGLIGWNFYEWITHQPVVGEKHFSGLIPSEFHALSIPPSLNTIQGAPGMWKQQDSELFGATCEWTFSQHTKGAART